MNGPALTLTGDDMPSAATARERVQRFLDGCPAHPDSFPPTDARRIIHDLIAVEELDEEQFAGLEQELSDLEDVQEKFDQFVSAVGDSIRDRCADEVPEPLRVDNIPDVLRRLLAKGRLA